MQLFATFHVPIVELYFPIMAWLGIKRIFKLIKYSPLGGSLGFFVSSLAPFPLSGMGLDFDVKSFERLPFGFSLAAFILMHPFHF